MQNFLEIWNCLRLMSDKWLQLNIIFVNCWANIAEQEETNREGWYVRQKFPKCCLLSNCELTRTKIFAPLIQRYSIEWVVLTYKLFLLHNFSLIKTTSFDLYTFNVENSMWMNEENAVVVGGNVSNSRIVCSCFCWCRWRNLIFEHQLTKYYYYHIFVFYWYSVSFAPPNVLIYKSFWGELSI